MQCQAKSHGTQQQCKRTAVTGLRVCVYHGGKSLRGAASGTFKHGKYSKYLPARLLDRYHEAASDQRLLELKDEIALVDSHLGELLVKIDTGEAGKIWLLAKSAFQNFRKANIDQDPVKQQEALFELSALLDKGADDYILWGEIFNTIDTRRKLVESERKRLVEMQQIITAEQGMTLIAAITAIIKNRVTDIPTFRQISTDLIQLASRADGRVIDASSRDSEAAE